MNIHELELIYDSQENRFQVLAFFSCSRVFLFFIIFVEWGVVTVLIFRVCLFWNMGGMFSFYFFNVFSSSALSGFFFRRGGVFGGGVGGLSGLYLFSFFHWAFAMCFCFLLL